MLAVRYTGLDITRLYEKKADFYRLVSKIHMTGINL